jgi:hypothetical protein
MTLIPQTKTMSCWYASVQMLIQWRREEMGVTEMAMPDLSQDYILAKMSDQGIPNRTLIHMAQKMGLEAIPPMTPTEPALESWLRRFGPLCLNGKEHYVVIAGIRPGEILIYDPSPLNLGAVGWRRYPGTEVDLRDNGRNVREVFLHCPPLEAVASADQALTYTVRSGDNLSKIADYFYDDPNMCHFIYAANKTKIANPDRIQPGQMLAIP